MGRRIEAIPSAVMEALVRYAWPGNIRELQNVIERAVILSPGLSLQVPLGDLAIREQRPEAGSQGSEVGGEKPAAEDGTLLPSPTMSTWCPGRGAGGEGSVPPASGLTLADAEREHILGALRETGWVVGGPKGAAARLGMKRSMLYWTMKKLGIFRPE